MKQYLIPALVVILALTSGLLVGCAQEAELENRITTLETRLSTAESTIKVLQQKVEQLEKASLTEADILRTLQGKGYWANVGGRGMQVWFSECISLED